MCMSQLPDGDKHEATVHLEQYSRAEEDRRTKRDCELRVIRQRLRQMAGLSEYSLALQ